MAAALRASCLSAPSGPRKAVRPFRWPRTRSGRGASRALRHPGAPAGPGTGVTSGTKHRLPTVPGPLMPTAFAFHSCSQWVCEHGEDQGGQSGGGPGWRRDDPVGGSTNYASLCPAMYRRVLPPRRLQLGGACTPSLAAMPAAASMMAANAGLLHLMDEANAALLRACRSIIWEMIKVLTSV